MANTQIAKIASAAGLRLPSVRALSLSPAVPVTLVPAGLSLINSIIDCVTRLKMALIQDRESERKFQLAMSSINERRDKIKSDLIAFEEKIEHIADASMQSLSLIRFSMETLASLAIKETDGDRQIALIKELVSLNQQATTVTRECMQLISTCSLTMKRLEETK